MTPLKRFEPKFGLYEYEARNGYRYLAVGKLAKHQPSIEVFHSEYEGINLLRSLAERFSIDHRFCKYGRPAEGDAPPRYDLTNLPDAAHHNQQVEHAIDFVSKDRPSFAIIDKGRSADERSYIWVENGHFYGMGYASCDIGFTVPSEVREYVTPYKSNQYIMQLLQSFALKYPGKVVYQRPLSEAG